MFRKMLFVLLLMLVAVTSACTGGKTGAFSQTEGLVITKFEALPSSIYNGEEVTLALEVLNKGGPGIIARDAKAYILNMNLGGWEIVSAERADIKTGTTQQQTTATPSTPSVGPFKVKTGPLPVKVTVDYVGKKVVKYYARNGNQDVLSETKTCEENENPCTGTVTITADTTHVVVQVFRFNSANAENLGGIAAPEFRVPVSIVLPSAATHTEIQLSQTSQPAQTTNTQTPSASNNAVLLAWNAGDIYGASKDGTLKAIPDGTTWTIKAGNNLARTLDVNFNPKVRVCYNYQTEATTVAKAIRLDELRSQQQRGTFKESDISTHNSGGPIQMKITTRQPIIVRNTEGSKLKLTVDISNVDPLAGGLVFIPKEEGSCLNPGDQRNKVLVAIEVVGANCASSVGKADLRTKPATMSQSFYDFYTKNNIPQEACLDYVTMSDGRNALANYEFDLTDAIVGEKELTVRLTAFYGYYTEAETRFSVSPTPE